MAENKKVTFSNGDVFDYLPMFAPRRLAHSAILADMEDTNTSLLGCFLQDSATRRLKVLSKSFFFSFLRKWVSAHAQTFS